MQDCFAMHGRDASAPEHHLNVCAPPPHGPPDHISLVLWRQQQTRSTGSSTARHAKQPGEDLEALEADLTKIEAGARSLEAQKRSCH